ncbi:MAG: hypothetical protein ABI742_00530 [Gemmatimonadota bacterium]
MAAAHEYNFTDDCRVGIVQARFEALYLGTRVVDAGHLVLGVTKTIGQSTFDLLFPVPERFAQLCRSLGAAEAAAPVSAEDITYSTGAMEAIAGAMRSAAALPEGAIAPLHLLLGVHRPETQFESAMARPSFASDLLDVAGVTAVHLEALVAGAPRKDA